ncbi:hypothetical protein Micbo1qcDRAFT_215126 [Microdochium bolleyi]|uniref:Small secreted protein n=1 Tax=Microdochium bolleyi TaxID=196109 RepID=A0A136ISQ2_9PEZI|nr:hypothetical protein Micbo1qcDRAFT_215126 [Microdochium bolleyi]
MRISAILIAGVLPLLASTSPVPTPEDVSTTLSTASSTAEEVSMMAASPPWTIEAMKRDCNKDNTRCKWSFRINDKSGAAPVKCAFTIDQKPGSVRPASQTDGRGFDCGVYRVGQGWDGSFGQGNGFATLSVVNRNTRNIIWPGYTDKQLAGGRVVRPNQSYAPVRLA